MNIYIDFDDCLCETARHFTALAEELFGKKILYDSMKYFDMKKSFDLSEEQYEHMMIAGHSPEALLSIEETPGASETINGWIDSGYTVSIITGRPYSAYEPSRIWLDQHGLGRVALYCLDKYGRDSFIKGSSFNLELEDFYKMEFDYAIEDSPVAFKIFEHMPNLKVMVYDRPWNQSCEFPGDQYHRCFSWDEIRTFVTV